jgi:hypothetical protein
VGKISYEEQEQKIRILEKEIFELRKVRDELHETNEIFNLFMEHSPVYTFFKDRDIRSIKLSKNYEKMMKKRKTSWRNNCLMHLRLQTWRLGNLILNNMYLLLMTTSTGY